jgi:hypothetical protein
LHTGGLVRENNANDKETAIDIRNSGEISETEKLSSFIQSELGRISKLPGVVTYEITIDHSLGEPIPGDPTFGMTEGPVDSCLPKLSWWKRIANITDFYHYVVLYRSSTFRGNHGLAVCLGLK